MFYLVRCEAYWDVKKNTLNYKSGMNREVSHDETIIYDFRTKEEALAHIAAHADELVSKVEWDSTYKSYYVTEYRLTESDEPDCKVNPHSLMILGAEENLWLSDLPKTA